MTRFNLLLLALVVASAAGTVAAQQRTRELATAVDQALSARGQLDTEWGQLQLEQSTWGMLPRVERIAVGQLAMRRPDSGQVAIIPLPERTP